MMQVRVMRMPVDEANMPMPMRMRLTRWIVRAMIVLMMLVVTMPMLMLHGFVKVLMLVPFGQMQPEPDAHESRRRTSSCRDSGSPSMATASNGAHKRRQREVCASACRAEVPQPKNEQGQAYAIAQETDDAGRCDDAG